jgi:hypothetical protein
VHNNVGQRAFPRTYRTTATTTTNWVYFKQKLYMYICIVTISQWTCQHCIAETNQKSNIVKLIARQLPKTHINNNNNNYYCLPFMNRNFSRINRNTIIIQLYSFLQKQLFSLVITKKIFATCNTALHFGHCSQSAIHSVQNVCPHCNCNGSSNSCAVECFLH